MSIVERQLTGALAAADDVMASADLYARVTRSIDDDRRRRRQRRAIAAIVACCLGALAAVTVATVGPLPTPTSTSPGAPGAVATDPAERLEMDWWILELMTNAVLIALAVWLGPHIKRFGRSYAADVFRANPRTGKSFLVLTDIAYYLIFAAFVLFTLRFEPEVAWGGVVAAEQLKQATMRVGGILLIMGVLHSINLLVLPMVGQMLTHNRHLADQMAARSEER